ncbi:MAG: uroporphyrinogen-III synthase [Chlamydiae bacterium]|nr:uroporphyrinogen-III synthase [Chlamydiota bacterium]
MILYLGLDPSRWKRDKPLLHYPVIRIAALAISKPADWSAITHLIFTSRSAAFHWQWIEGKQVLAIGKATTEVLEKKKCSPLIAPEATQEGMIELLKTLSLQDAYLLWPRSTLSRELLSEYLFSLSPIARVQILDLYETHYQRPEPVPSLEDIDEIVFTSPSTVTGFLQIYGSLPSNKKLTPIGPITAAALEGARAIRLAF